MIFRFPVLVAPQAVSADGRYGPYTSTVGEVLTRPRLTAMPLSLPGAREVASFIVIAAGRCYRPCL